MRLLTKVSGGNLEMDTKDEFVAIPGPGLSFPWI